MERLRPLLNRDGGLMADPSRGRLDNPAFRDARAVVVMQESIVPNVITVARGYRHLCGGLWVEHREEDCACQGAFF